MDIAGVAIVYRFIVFFYWNASFCLESKCALILGSGWIWMDLDGSGWIWMDPVFALLISAIVV